MKFQFWNFFGTIIALAKFNGKNFYVTGKTKDEAIAKAWQLATS